MSDKTAAVELHSGGIGGKITGHVNVTNAIVIVTLIAYFLYTQHEFASLHAQIDELQTELTRCLQDIQLIVETMAGSS